MNIISKLTFDDLNIYIFYAQIIVFILPLSFAFFKGLRKKVRNFLF